MEKQQSPINKIFPAIIAVCGWFALVMQLYLIIITRTGVLSEAIIRYFSYFTILSNILVAVCCTVLLLKPGSKWGSFFSRQQTLTAIAVYILIVGLIYNTILRFTWEPKGLQLIVDELLHTVVPLLFLIFWLLIVPKGQLIWKNILPWLIFPFAYIIFVLIRGASSGFYPYPFINAYSLGINKVVVNSVGITLLFIIISIAFVAVAKLINKKI